MDATRVRQGPEVQGWLDVLSAVMPPRATLLIGAGSGTGSWVQWLRERNVGPTWLVEADEDQYRHLLRNLPTDSGWTPRQDVVVRGTGPAVFHRASNPAESGLVPARELQWLWPHLKSTQELPVDGVTLDSLASDAGVDINWLLVDCLPAAELLAGGEQLLTRVDVVLLRVLCGAKQEGAFAAHCDASDELMLAHGLKRVHLSVGRHPAIAHALYVRDITQLQIQLDRARTEARNHEERAEELAQALESAQQQLEEQSLAHQAELNRKTEPPVQGLFAIPAQLDGHYAVSLGMNTNRPNCVRVVENVVEFAAEDGSPLYFVSNEDGDFSKPPQASQLAIDPDAVYTLRGRIAYDGESRPQVWLFQYDETKRIDSHSLPVGEAGRFRMSFKALPSMKSVAVGVRVAGHGRLMLADTTLRLFEDVEASSTALLKAKLAAIEQSQKREVHNAVKQIESFIRLQHYFGSELLVPEVHNWPISPDFGVLLIQLVEQHAYDAVIEFGSGTSTLVLAKALERVAGGQRQPAPLLSFDHLEEYAELSRRNLVQAGLDRHARVELAPLVPWHSGGDAGQEYPYYSCDETLTKFRRDLHAPAPKVLVVVDGPPASTSSLARYPAMAKVLQAFDDARCLHFLMDDYVRPEEQRIVQAWEAELSQRKRPYRRQEFDKLEKKACLLETTPISEAKRSE